MDRLMDQEKLKGILDAEIDNSLGYIQTDTTDERSKAIEYYNREPYGNEVEGRSQIVTGEVAEVVDGALPQLLRIFTQSDEMVRFEPRSFDDEQKALQATEYVNWVMNRDNDGVSLMHTWFKDALLQKNGIIKVYWDEVVDVTKEKYQDLNEQELTMLLSDDSIEVSKQEQIEVDSYQDPMTGMIVPMFSYNVTVKKTNKTGKVVIENVPPEEFLISKKARTIGDSPFVAHRRLITRSELIAMGFNKKIVEDLPSWSDLTYTQERVARYSNGENPDVNNSTLDPAMEDIEVYECYLKVDMDGDGIAELRKVVYAGSEILDDTEIDFVPFCSICPIPMPHKFFGHSLADRSMDIQLIKSTVTRQILDNMYMTNSPRMGVVEGQVNLDDLLTVTANGVVRIKNPNAIVPLTVPATAAQSFPLLEYLDVVQTKRTGVNDAQQGLNPDILQNTTATAVAAMQSASAGRIELIARIFAETGVKDLFQKILQLLCKYQDKARVIRLRGKYVSIDPREWTNQFDMSINVGLGTGNKQEQMTMIAMVLGKQEEILKTIGVNNPLVDLGQYRNTLGRFIESAGFKDSSEFFKEISPEQLQMMAQPQEQQQDPQVQAYMAQVQAQIQADQMKAQAEMQLAREKAMAQMQLEREKFEQQMALKQQEFEYEAQLKAMQIGAKLSPTANIPNVL